MRIDPCRDLVSSHDSTRYRGRESDPPVCATLRAIRGGRVTTLCTNCGTENKSGRKFCVGCASPLASTCPNCGAAVESGDRFCGECATPLP
ncbi:MAG: zinc ribbon domain-containing protein, partial [Thermomicrobiales bacterium]